MQSFAGIKSDTVKLQGINCLAAAKRGNGIYDTECSVLNHVTYMSATYCYMSKFRRSYYDKA